MSDFTSNFWSMYVAGITILSVLFCIVILVVVGNLKVHTAADNTTGHVWDDNLREMNNPLPRWWSYMFWFTIVFAIAYFVLYPGIGSFPGTLGWTSTGQHKSEVDKGNAETAPIYAKFTSMKPEDLAKDAQAMAIGERLFSNNCAQCHASDARGNKGFPNLTDGDWLHGGTPEKIKETITGGRNGNMPPMAAAVGSAEDVKNVAQYALSLSGAAHDSARAALGQEKFAVCAACHGPDGKGMQAVGAANLTDKIWLHGPGTEKTVLDMVNNGRVNVMPAQAEKLTEAQIHVLTAYIWGLSNK
ncbi:MAG: cytochrome c oxidase cbb3-type subunit III [Comamonadaceae bacterium]|nr:MAG: cytochrome c oxidase cbb3-type subunit III [Comamonadaceae bacterium]